MAKLLAANCGSFTNMSSSYKRGPPASVRPYEPAPLLDGSPIPILDVVAGLTPRGPRRIGDDVDVAVTLRPMRQACRTKGSSL
eukprot:CAMPEP_0172565010 /NCGR_PEP_ID=MMETSP1067-20121228/106581_1 /TAXON_ID=265564 ORGANISM="Thalassiosira punctigera, Strain Tpunct2005C2" /NCGR_SAMPLE_ID=MMETSP1067 /ASSEMBLY_ACC=CAM_ASM_000444 /LENGTH=82 /DNA_ID=CAMNT_0013355813 /DNA_START=12 /DNA_END=257 /DNA_ORIENTATION=-